MSTATKALILTWVGIGFLIVGAVGFYLGRLTAPKNQTQNPPAFTQPGNQQPGQQFGQPSIQPTFPPPQVNQQQGGFQNFGPPPGQR